MRILWNKWLTVLKKCNWKAAAYGRCETPFFRNKAAVVSLIILAFIIIFITVARVSSHLPSIEDTDWNDDAAPTMSYHFFRYRCTSGGAVVRTAIGGRISLLVRYCGAFISVTIG